MKCSGFTDALLTFLFDSTKDIACPSMGIDGVHEKMRAIMFYVVIGFGKMIQLGNHRNMLPTGKQTAK